MHGTPALAVVPLVVVVAISACGPTAPSGPTLMLTGGRVYATPDTTVPAQALAIEGNTVLAVGPDSEIRALAGTSTQEMGLDGATVLPGLTDAWIDLEAAGRWSEGLDLRGAATPREIRAKLREATAIATTDWLVGWGWDESIWPQAQLPDHHLLDDVTSDRPVALWHRSGRLVLLNSTAMDASGLAATSDEGLVTTAAGAWSGIAYGPALQRLARVLPQPPAAERRQWIAAGLRVAAAAGYTSVTTSPIDAQAVEILRRMEADGDLAIRVEIRARPSAAAVLGGRRDQNHLQVGAIGLEIDGPFGPHLASLRQPYSDLPGAGPRVDRDAIDAACALATSSDLRLDVQVHGDAALQAALTCDLLRQGRGLVIGADMSAPILSADAASIAVAAVPLRLAHDMYFLERRVGSQRAATMHPLRDLLAGGHLVGVASLAPRYSSNPLAAAWVSWKRQDLQGYPLDGWFAPQRISVRDALRLQVGGWPRPPRILEPKADADLVVWSADPFQDSDAHLPQARAMVTLVAGRVVYSRPLVQPDLDFRH